MQKLKKLSITNILVLALFLLSSTVIFSKELTFYIDGDYIQGGIIFGKTEQGNRVFFNKAEIPIDEAGEFIIGIGRNHTKFGRIKLIKKEKVIFEQNLEIIQRNYQIQKINNLEKNKVSPPEEVYARIKREYKKIKIAKSSIVNYSYYKVGFKLPAQGIITGVYGSQRVLNGIPKRPHYGIDIANNLGTPILAPSDGKIVMVEDDLYFSGGTIIISHGRGFTSSLLHLKKILVKKDQIIKKGQTIGLMGDTGRATGSHLDWRMEIRGVRVDPYLLLNNTKKIKN
tara:strand:- start:236 stop:1087 length:852 start_codon:yes stop_codon:yes gene_type:complete